MKNYCDILKVNVNASIDDIRKAFYKLAKKYHPDKNQSTETDEKFKEVLKAYKALTIAKSNLSPNNKFTDDSDYSSNYNSNTETDTDSDYNFDANVYEDKNTTDHINEYILWLTLEEILNGCVKKIEILRKVSNCNGSIEIENKIFTIIIKPGWSCGTKITFHKEGDQLPGRISKDVVFHIHDKPHLLFQRSDIDIIFVQRLSCNEALNGLSTDFPLLDGSYLPFTSDDIIQNNSTKTFLHYGLPDPHRNNIRGNYIVKFEIQ